MAMSKVLTEQHSKNKTAEKTLGFEVCHIKRPSKTRSMALRAFAKFGCGARPAFAVTRQVGFRCAPAARFCAAAEGAAPVVEDAAPVVGAPSLITPPHIETLADQICVLNLLEASQLNDALKDKLGITDLGVGMPMMAAPDGGAPAAEEAVAEQTEFEVSVRSDVEMNSGDLYLNAYCMRSV